jgi:hypothetical protein
MLYPIICRSGLVVKFVLAMHEPRVRFTAATSFCILQPHLCRTCLHFCCSILTATPRLSPQPFSRAHRTWSVSFPQENFTLDTICGSMRQIFSLCERTWSITARQTFGPILQEIFANRKERCKLIPMLTYIISGESCRHSAFVLALIKEVSPVSYTAYLAWIHESGHCDT